VGLQVSQCSSSGCRLGNAVAPANALETPLSNNFDSDAHLAVVPLLCTTEKKTSLFQSQIIKAPKAIDCDETSMIF